MIEAITIVLNGEKFNARDFFEKAYDSNKFIMEGILSNSDFQSQQHRVSGCFINSKRFGCCKKFTDYENMYIDFLCKNYDLIQKVGIYDIQLWIDLYMTKLPHGYEVFTRDNLKKLGNMNVAIPMDFHILSKKRIIKLAKEKNINYDFIDDIY